MAVSSEASISPEEADSADAWADDVYVLVWSGTGGTPLAALHHSFHSQPRNSTVQVPRIDMFGLYRLNAALSSLCHMGPEPQVASHLELPGGLQCAIACRSDEGSFCVGVVAAPPALVARTAEAIRAVSARLACIAEVLAVALCSAAWEGGASPTSEATKEGERGATQTFAGSKSSVGRSDREPEGQRSELEVGSQRPRSIGLCYLPPCSTWSCALQTLAQTQSVKDRQMAYEASTFGTRAELSAEDAGRWLPDMITRTEEAANAGIASDGTSVDPQACLHSILRQILWAYQHPLPAQVDAFKSEHYLVSSNGAARLSFSPVGHAIFTAREAAPAVMERTGKGGSGVGFKERLWGHLGGGSSSAGSASCAISVCLSYYYGTPSGHPSQEEKLLASLAERCTMVWSEVFETAAVCTATTPVAVSLMASSSSVAGGVTVALIGVAVAWTSASRAIMYVHRLLLRTETAHLAQSVGDGFTVVNCGGYHQQFPCSVTLLDALVSALYAA